MNISCLSILHITLTNKDGLIWEWNKTLQYFTMMESCWVGCVCVRSIWNFVYYIIVYHVSYVYRICMLISGLLVRKIQGVCKYFLPYFFRTVNITFVPHITSLHSTFHITFSLLFLSFFFALTIFCQCYVHYKVVEMIRVSFFGLMYLVCKVFYR